LALLAALPLEVRPFLRQVKARRLKGVDLPAWEFDPGEGRGVLALTGMGEEAAARAGTEVMVRWRPQILVSLGFSGALLPGLAPGHLVLGDSFRHYDPSTGVLEEVAAPAPPRPLPELARRLEEAGLPVATGSLVTTPAIIHKGRQGEPLQRLPHPVLDLETSALAGVAATAGIPFLALRVITDTGGEEIPDFIREGWDPGSGPGLSKALGWLAVNPRRLKAMLHLWRRSRLAAARLAAGLEVVLPLC
jgi:adenosylhomocysteine nucleosidase